MADIVHFGKQPFDGTLIVWSGEFGRMTMAQGNKGTVGRDHHNKAMSMWLAGSGTQRGTFSFKFQDLDARLSGVAGAKVIKQPLT